MRDDYVTPDDIIDGEVTIQCAHGDVVTYPLAAVKITVGGKEIIVHAAVAKSLPVAALLGWDVPELIGFVKPNPDAEPSDTIEALAVVTRQQKESPDTSSCDTDFPNPPSKAPPDELPQTSSDPTTIQRIH